MSLKNKSEVNMIQGPEFINLQPLDINPLMEKCEIKVFYLGHNRNGSYINKETALNMAKTLRGTPIVAAYNKDKEDFGDHGHIIHIEDGEISFSVKTIPYGFVSPDAEIWFQNFTDTDEFDNQVERTYLMTTGYLWVGQFEELQKVINEGQPHSMELDEKSLDGHWAKDNNLGVDFFIINDATFSKLCVLGDDVEPCYEGSSVTAPEVSKNFSQTDFQQTLFSMINDLKFALDSKGGLNMSEEENVEVIEEETESTEEVDFSENGIEEQEKVEEEFAETESTEVIEEESEVEDEPESTFTAEQFNKMNEELESLRAEVAELREFKLNVVNQEKDALIKSYYMLSDEDKAEIVARKAEYTLDEIKAQLALLYVEKNVNFDIDDKKESQEEEVTVTFSLDDEVNESVPALVAALRDMKN